MHSFQCVIVEYGKGFHTDNSTFPKQKFEFVTLKAWQQCYKLVPPPHHNVANKRRVNASICQELNTGTLA